MQLILTPNPPVHTYTDGDMTETDREKERINKQKRAALRSSVIQELRQQYSDAPEEISDRRDFQTERQSREEQYRYVMWNYDFLDNIWYFESSFRFWIKLNMFCKLMFFPNAFGKYFVKGKTMRSP